MNDKFTTTAVVACGNNAVAPCPHCDALMVFPRLREYYANGASTATPARCSGCNTVTTADQVRIPLSCWQPIVSHYPSAIKQSEGFRKRISAAHGGLEA